MRQDTTITDAELGRRLRRAREACGMTQDEVAAELGVSRPTITQMELGNRAVSSLELDRLAYRYGRDLREFMAPTFRDQDALGVLFRADSDVLARPETRARITKSMALARSLTNLERFVGIARDQSAVQSYRLPPMKGRWDAVQQGQAVADDERRRLGLGWAPVPEAEELLESQGIRTGMLDLPPDVSGVTLRDPEIGPFVVVNEHHAFYRRRFSFMHEYEHVLADQEVTGYVSRSSRRDDLLEVRANAFAAAFLMPEEGVRRFVAMLGKGRPSRDQARLFDEDASLAVEGRAESKSQELQLYDVVRLAHHFAVSCIAALYRLNNLKLVSAPRFEALKGLDEEGQARALAQALGLPPVEDERRDGFRRQFVGLALEAYRREKITRAKLNELSEMVSLSPQDVDRLLAEAGIEDAGTDAVIPDGAE